MRRRTQVLAATLLAGTMVACADLPAGPQSADFTPLFTLTNAAQCGPSTIADHRASSGRKIGTVEIYNTATSLHVIFSMIDGATVRESHVHAALSLAGIPVNGGRAALGKFDYVSYHNPALAAVNYAIPLANIGSGANTGDDVYVAPNTFGESQGLTRAGWPDGMSLGPNANSGTAMVHTIQPCGTPPPPPPGNDVVVYNDINMLDNNSLGNANNVLMAQNLVNYTHSGSRGTATEIQIDCGRGSISAFICGSTYWGTARTTWAGAGFSITDIASSSGTLTSFGPNVKVVFLINPCVAYTKEEINAMKAFAVEGGRVVFVGEWEGYYPTACIAIENQFLLDMGAQMTNAGLAYDCGYNTLPAASLRPHQVTTGMTNVTMACSSEIVPGPNDFPLYYDLTNTRALSGVATIDPTPLSSTSVPNVALMKDSGVRSTSPTGQ